MHVCMSAVGVHYSASSTLPRETKKKVKNVQNWNGSPWWQDNKKDHNYKDQILLFKKGLADNKTVGDIYSEKYIVQRKKK